MPAWAIPTARPPYFLNMYLRDVRAIEYVRSHPNWDGRTVVIMGTSMGGQQSFAVAGLVPDQINAMLVNVLVRRQYRWATIHGQRQGYPGWASADPRVVATARPISTPVSFAPDIRAAVMVAPGFLDVTSPPYGIIAAFNAIPGAKELVPMVESDHNHITPQKQEAWYRRSARRWNSCAPLAASRPIPTGTASGRAVRAQAHVRAHAARVPVRAHVHAARAPFHAHVHAQARGCAGYRFARQPRSGQSPRPNARDRADGR